VASLASGQPGALYPQRWWGALDCHATCPRAAPSPVSRASGSEKRAALTTAPMLPASVSRRCLEADDGHVLAATYSPAVVRRRRRRLWPPLQAATRRRAAPTDTHLADCRAGRRASRGRGPLCPPHACMPCALMPLLPCVAACRAALRRASPRRCAAPPPAVGPVRRPPMPVISRHLPSPLAAPRGNRHVATAHALPSPRAAPRWVRSGSVWFGLVRSGSVGFAVVRSLGSLSFVGSEDGGGEAMMRRAVIIAAAASSPGTREEGDGGVATRGCARGATRSGPTSTPATARAAAPLNRCRAWAAAWAGSAGGGARRLASSGGSSN